MIEAQLRNAQNHDPDFDDHREDSFASRSYSMHSDATSEMGDRAGIVPEITEEDRREPPGRFGAIMLETYQEEEEADANGSVKDAFRFIRERGSSAQLNDMNASELRSYAGQLDEVAARVERNDDSLLEYAQLADDIRLYAEKLEDLADEKESIDDGDDLSVVFDAQDDEDDDEDGIVLATIDAEMRRRAMQTASASEALNLSHEALVNDPPSPETALKRLSKAHKWARDAGSSIPQERSAAIVRRINEVCRAQVKEATGLPVAEVQASLLKGIAAQGGNVSIGPDNIAFVENTRNGSVECHIVGVPGIAAMSAVLKRDGTVHLNLAEIEPSSQGNDVMKGFMRGILNLARETPDKTRFQKLSMVANLSVGGYAWARAGFTPDGETFKELAEDALDMIDLYRRTVDGNNKALNTLRRRIAAECDKDDGEVDTTLIREIAALKLRIPEEKHADFWPEQWRETGEFPKAEMKGDFTLGKACLLGSEWAGGFDVEKDSEYLAAYAFKKALGG